MSENKITRANIKISFGTSSGFSSQAGYKSQNSDAVLDAASELAFLLQVEGRLSDLEAAIEQLKEPACLARNQPCGCVICRCEHDEQCQGCGAKNCGTHPAGEIPNPVYEQQGGN